MDNILLILCFVVAIASLIVSVYAGARVGRIMTISENLDWETLGNLAGDNALIKRQLKQLNNRLNGWEKSDETNYTREQLEALAAGAGEQNNVKPFLGG